MDSSAEGDQRCAVLLHLSEQAQHPVRVPLSRCLASSARLPPFHRTFTSSALRQGLQLQPLAVSGASRLLFIPSHAYPEQEDYLDRVAPDFAFPASCLLPALQRQQHFAKHEATEENMGSRIAACALPETTDKAAGFGRAAAIAFAGGVDADQLCASVAPSGSTELESSRHSALRATWLAARRQAHRQYRSAETPLLRKTRFHL